MKKKNFSKTALYKLTGVIIFTMMGLTLTLNAQQKARLVINADQGEHQISRHIYGHFSEHLGRCIYGGYWVGEESEIPNIRGIRTDVVDALRKTAIPNLRWPGGCFADEYHWTDGIGPREERPTMINTHWGGVTEDNSFGTHEFLELCEQLGTEPVIVGNVGSGTPDELSKWVEYVNFDGVSPMADMRRENGQDKPWKVVYWGIGNENWGCGGNMTPEYYSDLYRRFATYARNYGDVRLRKIAGGANASDYNWTETLMKNIPHWMMWGLSLHHYTTRWESKGPATGFSESRYFDVLDRCLRIEDVIDRHISIMDRYDPQKRVAMVVDEWGTWYDVEQGTNPGFLFQQNTMRDAFVAGLSLNYFNEKCDRIRMANIAQTVNVLQALVLTDDEKMLLTPTYHIFEMYSVHHDATLLPSELSAGDYEFEGRKIPALSASASKNDRGIINISIVNIHPEEASEMEIDLRGQDISGVSGRILTSADVGDHNTFDQPDKVKPEVFRDANLDGNILTAIVPAGSVVVLEVK
ncbi:MAG: alpha-N-arabinofuranosidase [Bacteroidota bacterium]